MKRKRTRDPSSLGASALSAATAAGVPARPAVRVWLLFALSATLIVALAYLTVHRRSADELQAHLMGKRMHVTLTYWHEHGFFRTAGLPARIAEDGTLYLHQSSTSGRLIGPYLVEKVSFAVLGRYSFQLLAAFNLGVLAMAGVAFGVLAHRLARRAGAPPQQALWLAATAQVVWLTFPEQQSVYWGTTGREYWLLFASVFLLLQDDEAAPPDTRRTVWQALALFACTYTEIVAGIALTAAHAAGRLILAPGGRNMRRDVVWYVLPALAAVALHRGQHALAAWLMPAVPQEGSPFLFRTGLDGATTYYQDHWDIALRRDSALFGWKWLFLVSSLAAAGVFAAGAWGKLTRWVLLVMSSLLGAYVITGAVFSQAVAIHPYLYDSLLHAPLVLALFVLAPALMEKLTERRGVILLICVLGAVWVSMGQLRQYAVRYPSLSPAIGAGMRTLPSAIQPPVS